jgi:uncharacterized protein YndB with AHSA1/START domain
MTRFHLVALVSALAFLGCSGAGGRGGGSAQPSPRELRKEALVPASPSQVWMAWTTLEGAKSFFAPDAKIDLRVGGAYEMYFDPSQEPGRRGSEGCTILGVEAEKRLVFTWNFPPSLPSIRKQKTVVEVMLLEENGKTRVRLTQRGFKLDSDWQKGRDYFDRAWDTVLSRLVKRFETDSSTLP